MNSGQSRGDRWLDGAAWRRTTEPGDGAGYRDRADPDPRPGRAGGPPSDTLDTGEWLRAGGADVGPFAPDITESGQTLFSGPGAELYGMGGGGAGWDGTPSSDRARHDPGPSSRDHGPESRDPGPSSWDPGPSSWDSGPPSWDLPSPVPRRPGETATEPEDTSSGLVRPYFRTRGRTKPDYDLAVEALISTSERGRRLDRVRVPEHRSICGLCLDTRSVAEVAALLGMPLGVVRILVGDVAGLGLVLVHSASSMVGDRPSIEFMERVLSGLRRI
ncbi:DUF742 domain-containing protein [Saccharomonospora halophila]|uniref:DUF742 domain-containing protein n=1 Tax=Saccharomonospora halophila TaxID=129922 RepID=UPI00036E083D|nr:DUF742 domain-containing protein [Saccharomonospora halophila]